MELPRYTCCNDLTSPTNRPGKWFPEHAKRQTELDIARHIRDFPFQAQFERQQLWSSLTQKHRPLVAVITDTMLPLSLIFFVIMGVLIVMINDPRSIEKVGGKDHSANVSSHVVVHNGFLMIVEAAMNYELLR
jgi:hypothetical protein